MTEKKHPTLLDPATRHKQKLPTAFQQSARVYSKKKSILPLVSQDNYLSLDIFLKPLLNEIAIVCNNIRFTGLLIILVGTFGYSCDSSSLARPQYP